jgi:hypothetical protein
MDPDQNYFYYFSREDIPKKENFYVGLSRIPTKETQKDSEKLIPIIKETVPLGQFPGFLTNQGLFRNVRWANESQFVVVSEARSSLQIFLVDVMEKKAEHISEPSLSTVEWGSWKFTKEAFSP